MNNIIDRAKEALGVSLDSDFAKKIGILPSTLTNWRKRGTINYPLLMSKCMGTSLDWLISGSGERRPASVNTAETSADRENLRISYLENQIRELFNLYHEKLEQNPLTGQLVEIPLFTHLVPDGSYSDPRQVDRYMVVSKEFVRDKNATFAIKLPDNRMAGEGFMQNDLLIVDKGLPVRDRCLAVVMHKGVQSLKKLFLREGILCIAPGQDPDELTQVSLGKDFRLLGIVRKVVRELY
ncbi:MAG: hypothetical protein HGB20_04645 [Chlorobiaceae bacterium]|nr:hypothetical protein [Chlorobiaceae bacterium]